MKLIIKNVLLIALISFMSVLYADGEQLYFVGKLAPVVPVSGTSSDVQANAVYLRWDVTEGDLPEDVKSFILTKDNRQIGKDFPAHAFMDEVSIQKIYSEKGGERRLLQMIHLLNQKVQAENPADFVDENNYAAKIISALKSSDYWGMMASRLDINVARARYRAYIDTDIVAGAEYTYELIAVSTTGDSVRVGQVKVKIDSGTAIKMAKNFIQLKANEVARCDSSERFKVHNSVHLNWSHPGSNVPSIYANSLLINGYDIFVSSIEGGGSGPRFLIKEKPVNNSDGSVEFKDLVKLNEVPITISGEGDTEIFNEGWNPKFSQFVQQQDELLKLNMKAGETYTYYIVPVDFSGNYGDTINIDVTIPDMIAPVSPWSVRTQSNVSAIDAEAFALTWQQVNAANYYRSFKGGRKYCNLDSASASKSLTYVDDDLSCASDKKIEVMLDPLEYIVYRFDSIEEAKNFSDSDGDGYSDKDELVTIGQKGVFNLTDPVKACDASQIPSGLQKNYKIAVLPASSATQVDGREVLKLYDADMAVNKGKVLWYRIITRGSNDQLSPMSAPVRGFVPDRNLPPRPRKGTDIVVGQMKCTYPIYERTKLSSDPFNFVDLTQKASHVEVMCRSKTMISKFLSIDNQWSEKECLSFKASCLSEVSVNYFDALGQSIAVKQTDLEFCSRVYTLTEDCKNSVFTEIDTDGLIPLEEAELVVDIPAVSGCMKIYREINGEFFALDTLCNLPTRYTIPQDSFDGTNLCIAASAQNSNAENSPMLRLGCFAKYQERPMPPNAMEIVFDENSNTVKLKMSVGKEPISGTIIEWYQKDSAADSTTLSNFALTQEGFIQEHLLDIGALSNDSEEWCFRARSVAKIQVSGNEKSVSEWSNTICAVRAKDKPKYLPWPTVKSAPFLGNIEAHYLRNEHLPIVLLTNRITLAASQCDRVSILECTKSLSCVGSTMYKTFSLGYCPTVDFCSVIKNEMGGNFNFVMYRQEKDIDGNYSEFVQVSPLIDTLGCQFNNEETRLIDPFITIIDMQRTDVSFTGEHIVFKDVYPHEGGLEYRYQMVIFNDNGGIQGYKSSPWIQADL